MQERIKKYYPSVQLPEVFQEQNRGFAGCCEPMKVLAGGSESWKNDVNSAWILTSDPADTFGFEVLGSDDLPVPGYVPDSQEFPNEPNAFYMTVKWLDILSLVPTGGCFKIVVTYNIGGFIGSFVWGQYNLQPYTVENALGTARLRVILNLHQTIEGINFTGANVEDSIRFNGQIDKDQPNTEIKNLIYRDRTVKTIVNELLSSYLMTTDPYTDEVLKRLEQLYLLSANELFISDYNAHSNSYEILDTPVSMLEGESPEREKPEKYSRQVELTCKFGDRNINKRTYY